MLIITGVLFSCNRSLLVVNNKEQAAPSAREEYVKDEIIVKFKEGVTQERIKEINTSLGCEIIRSIGPTKTFLIKIKIGEDVKEVVDKFKLFDEVEYAEPNYIYHPLMEKTK